MRLVIEENRRALLHREPMIAWDLPIVHIHATISFGPSIELRGDDGQALKHPAPPELGPARVVAHEIDDRIAEIVGYPSVPQLSPSLFFNARYSSETSAMI